MTFVRPNDEPRVSGEIESYCGKCHDMTTHRVVAFEGAKIKKVLCLTCEAQHAYRAAPPKSPALKDPSAKGEGAATPAKSTKPKTSREPKGQAKPAQEIEESNRQWQAFKESLGEGATTPYSIHGLFETGQAIKHANFGLGLVTRVIYPNKIEVLFEKESKILITQVK
ncbi:MAG: hypothetical protein LBS60_01565 [Deltaproteobacteria bacterium]|jgi:hypothetical protein|nr:hypothetical protein [Deltaproteobacteria bacterium]